MSEQNTVSQDTQDIDMQTMTDADMNAIGSATVDPDVAQSIPNVMEKLQQSADIGAQDIERILDIPVQLSVEIGRTRTSIKNVLQLAQGSVVELDAQAGAPMDVLINGYLIAQGEVVVVNDRFGIRLTDIVTPAERMRRLNRG
ncbi:MAG: flagellar motor switch protein FliN [Lautropia sp.]|nr:flagellar motor switch protein FliN [Lautropia sp.]